MEVLQFPTIYVAFAQFFSVKARGTCSAIVHAVSVLPRTPTYHPPLTFYTYRHQAPAAYDRVQLKMHKEFRLPSTTPLLQQNDGITVPDLRTDRN